MYKVFILMIFFFLIREGYIRLSSEIYDLEKNENIDNKFMHLTNNAIQKYSNSYEQYEAGNQMSFKNFQVLSHLIKFYIY